ncbi:hypothetical protein TW80_13750 [Loktanella sp. S4079]|nr:hypothetical protein TW80_13750 [Loktanella sp. S4079]
MVDDPLDATPRDYAFGVTDVVLFLKRRWLLIAGIAAIIVVLVGAMLTTMQPRYTATAELTLIDQRQQSTPIADLVTGVPLSRQLVQQEIITMQSKAFMIEVVKRLEAESGTLVIEPPAPPIWPVRMLRGAKRFVAGLIMPAPAQVPVAEAPSQTVGETAEGDTPVEGQSNDPTQEAAFVVLAADLERYGETAEQLSRMIRVAQLGNSYVIGVSAQSTDPALAARIANAAAAEYTRFSLNIRGDAIEEQVLLLRDRVDDLGRNLEKAETDVVDFQQQVMGVDNISADRLASQITDLSRRLIDARADVVRADAQYSKVLEIVSDRGAVTAADVLSSPILGNVREELSQLRIDRSRAVELFGPESSQVRAIDAVINRISEETKIETARIVSEYETELNIAETIAEGINNDLLDLEGLMLTRSRNAVELSKLRRIADANRIAYEEFLTIATESAQYRALQQSTVRLLSYAEVPEFPSAPRSLLLLAASGVASLLFGLGVAILIEAVNNNIKTERQLRQVTGLPVIGSFSKISTGGLRRLRDNLRIGNKSKMGNDELTVISEGHAVSSFLLNVMDKDKGTIVVTSAVAGEGASTVALLFADALASQEESVLLIDAKNSSATQPEQAPSADWDPIQIIRTEAGVPTLTLSSAAQTDPRLMSERRKQELMQTITAKYDYVVVDAPPVLSSAIALRFVRDADAIVVTSRWNATARQTVEACVQKLRDLAADNMFAVMTQVKRSAERNYEYAGFSKATRAGKASS